MNNVFDLKFLNTLAEEISKFNLVSYTDLPKYDLFLSQVVDYLNDEFPNEKITKTIIQNYTKLQVAAKPENNKKRGYSKKHLIQLVLINYMKPLLTAEEMKKVFKLAFNDINDDSDDILSWEQAYITFEKVYKDNSNDNSIVYSNNEKKLDELIEKFNLKTNDKERIKIFLLVLSLIAEASIIKKIVKILINECSTY